MRETPENRQPAETTTEPTGIAWGDPITPERLAELKEMFERQEIWVAQPNRDIEQSVFKGIRLTGADVFWLAAIAVVGSEGDLVKIAVKLRQISSFVGLPTLHLEAADLFRAQLRGANLLKAHLEKTNLSGANLETANLIRVQMQGANLSGAQLQGANLFRAHLERANLSVANLQKAVLRRAHLEGATLREAVLEGATLREASFDKTSRLNDAQLHGVRLDQVIFDDTNLTVVKWKTVPLLGDERVAREAKGAKKRSEGFQLAARAYRSLSVALRNQGLGGEATRFHYRAELMERKSYFWQIFANLRSRRFYTTPAYFGRWLFSWLLGTFAGYGDYFGRLLLTYLLVVSAFAGMMFLAAGRVVSFDAIRDVFVLSITSFHGRGVQPPGLTMTDTLATLTAVEAFFGLLIEGIFIAAFTRRVTGN